MNQFGKAQPKQSAYDTSTPYGQQPAYNAYAPPGQAPKPQNQAPSAPYSNEAEWEQWRSVQWQTPPVDDALRPGRDYYVPAGQNPYLTQSPQLPFPVPQVTPQPGMQGGAAGWPGWAGQQQQGAYVRPGTGPGNTPPQAPMDEAQFDKRKRRLYLNADYEVDPFATYEDYLAAFSGAQPR